MTSGELPSDAEERSRLVDFREYVKCYFVCGFPTIIPAQTSNISHRLVTEGSSLTSSWYVTRPAAAAAAGDDDGSVVKYRPAAHGL